MAYLHTLPEFDELEKLFSDNDVDINCDLSNEFYFTIKGSDPNKDESWIDYDNLPQNLKDALYQWEIKYNPNCN